MPKDKGLPKEMLEAFQRIEQKVARELKPEDDNNNSGVRERELHRKKMLERVTLGLTILFSILIGVAAWYSRVGEDGTAGAPGSEEAAAGGAQGADTKVDCNDPRLKFTRYCIAKGSSDKTEASWDGLSRGDSRPFSIHNRETKQEKK